MLKSAYIFNHPGTLQKQCQDSAKLKNMDRYIPTNPLWHTHTVNTSASPSNLLSFHDLLINKCIFYVSSNFNHIMLTHKYSMQIQSHTFCPPAPAFHTKHHA